MAEHRPPTPEEIQKEFEDFIRNRFGGSVQVVTQQTPFAPQSGPNRPNRVGTGENTEPPKTPPPIKINFDLTPKEIKSHLDRFVIKQDEAKKALAIAVCDHYNRVRECLKRAKGQDEDYEYQKQNVLLLGPTGVGKSYLIKHIAKLIGVPFVKADATRFTEMGYVGANADDLVRDLVQQAQGNLELAQYGIVYLDEADKMAGSSNGVGRDVGGRGVQFSFLKLMEDTDVDLRSGNDPAAQMQAFMEMQQKGKVEKKIINTRHILFIVSGAFTGMEDIIKKRLNTQRIGFQNESSTPRLENTSDILSLAATQDFIEFGYEPEFIGRLPVRVACQPLTVDDLYTILKSSKGSIIKQYENSFANYGINVRFSDESLLKIAEKAHEQKTGARALMTVCEQIFRDYKFELPAKGVEKLEITAELIENPKAQLTSILQQAVAAPPLAWRRAAAKYEMDFLSKYAIVIAFDRAATMAVGEIADVTKRTIAEVCDEFLQGYEHGLKLIEQNIGTKKFIITAQMVANPKQELETMIKQSYLEKSVPIV